MRRIKRFFRSPNRQSYFLFGPRGIGKSTWVKHHYSDAYYIDLLVPNLHRKYEAYPEELFKVVADLKSGSTVIIDEVQRVPELLSAVHALIEEKRDIQFVLTGSSSRKLKRKGVDLLAGRAIRKEMHPFMAGELGEAFDLRQALKFGMLPLICGADDPSEVLQSYVDLYVIEEVQFEGLVRDISHFSRFLTIIAFSHGSILNLTNIARECEVKRHNVESFLGILRDLLLSHELPVFTRRAKRQLISHPKFYLFDSGVFHVMRRRGPMDRDSEIDGTALEGLVLQHLKGWCGYSEGKHEIFYWRTRSGLEVDFIIYGEKGFWAIEVKNGSKIAPHDLRGLNHFCEDYPECTPILLYRGKERIREGKILCMPCEDFLKRLSPNQSLCSD